eukprot:493740-Amphidinium_carterae.1
MQFICFLNQFLSVLGGSGRMSRIVNLAALLRPPTGVCHCCKSTTLHYRLVALVAHGRGDAARLQATRV